MTRHVSQDRKGFTLIELMIALAAGTVAIGAIYYLSGMASRNYNTQMRVAETQMELRMASEQLRRDFGRAGYLAAPLASDTSPADCTGRQIRTATSFQALTIASNGSVSGAVADLMGVSNPARLDQVQLIGNYATGEDYQIASGTGNTVTFLSTSQSFRRSFGATSPVWQAPFDDAFTVGRMLRIEDADGRRYFYNIASSQGAVPSVTLRETPSSCVETAYGSAVAAPVMRIEYSVVPIGVGSETEAAFQGLEATGPSARHLALVRREVDLVTSVAVPGSERIVLDYVTEFRVDAIIDTTGTGTFLEVSDSTAPNVDSAPANQFRSAIVTLAARSPEVDRKLQHIGRVNGAMMTFQVGAEPSDPAYGVARVRTLQTETFLYNLIR